MFNADITCTWPYTALQDKDHCYSNPFCNYIMVTLQGCTCVTLRSAYSLCGLMQVTRKLELDICDLEKGTFHTMPVVMQQSGGGFCCFCVVEAQGNMSECISLSHLRLPSPFQFGKSGALAWPWSANTQLCSCYQAVCKKATSQRW